jgi:hypothetical protein
MLLIAACEMGTVGRFPSISAKQLRSRFGTRIEMDISRNLSGV